MIGRRHGLRRVRPRVGSRIGQLEALESRQLLATFTVTNVASSGAGSLSGAITAANATPGLDRIVFSIPGAGPRVIAGGVPAVTDALEIDGTSQAGYSGQPLIVLDGSGAGEGAVGLSLQAPTAVRGLTISNFAAEGIRVAAGGSGSVIQQSYIGTNAAGTGPAPNGAGIVINAANDVLIGGDGLGNVISGNGVGNSVNGDGIRIEAGTTRNTMILGNRIGTSADGVQAVPNSGDGIQITFAGGAIIGGLAVGERNIISGNGLHGITVFQSQVPNTIQNNYVGTDVSGRNAVPNGQNGIDLFTADTQVGGAAPEARNVVSGNAGAGIRLFGAPRTIVRNNLVGTTADGNSALGNAGAGISIQGADGSQIGGVGVGNVVAYNGSAAFQEGGINIFSGSNITIRGNQVYENVGRGIRFFTVGGDTPPNDPLDADGGVNEGQNFPDLASASAGGGRTRVRGELSSTPGGAYTVEFFVSDDADPSGYGEGRTPIGTVTVQADSAGVAPLDVTLAAPVAPGSYITATATDAFGNTSEFSLAVPVGAVTVVDLGVTKVEQDAGADPATVGLPLTYLITARNEGPGVANDVTLVDPVPAGFLVQSVTVSGGHTYTQAGNVVTVDISSLGPDEEVTVAITVLPTAVGQFVNTATISSADAIDADPTNDSAEQATTVSQPIDLEVDVQAQLEPGQSSTPITEPITYLVSLLNTNADVPSVGPATGVVLDISLPPDVVILSASSSQGAVTPRPGNGLQVNVASLPVGSPLAVQIVVQPSEAGVTTITATASAVQTDVDPADNTATLNLNVDPAADLSLDMVAVPDAEVLLNEEVTFVLSAQNNGPSAAAGATIVGALPAGLEYVRSTTTQGTVSLSADGRTVTASLGDLADGATATVTIVARAIGTGPATVVATILSPVADQDSSNNVASIDATLDPADLEVTVATSPAAPASNQPLQYTITVRNYGPATATDVVLTDLLSSLVRYRGATLNGVPLDLTPQPTPQGPALTVPVGSIAPNSFATVVIDVVPSRGGILNNVATVQAGQADPTPENNVASVASAVDAADISVEITGPRGRISVGTPETYRVTVRNNGPLAASGLTIQGAIPAGAEYVVGSAAAGANVASVARVGDAIAALINRLPSGGVATFTYQLRPTAVGTLTVPAGYDPAAAGKVDPNPDNDGSSTSNAVTNLPGVIQFAQAVYQTDDNARTALIRVARTGGTRGTLTATYRTVAGTAAANVNFRPVSGTLTFLEGEFEKVIAVPILSDGKVTGAKTFSLVLSGAALGPQRNAQVRIAETDVDLVGPKVTGIQLLGGSSVTGFVLTFDEQLAAGPARSLSNYVVFAGAGTGRPITARSVAYNDANRTVTVQLAAPLPSGPFNRILVNGSAPTGLTDRFGNLLDGNADGRPGGNYEVSYARGKNLTYLDGNGDTVNLRLSGPGNIEILRGGAGDAQLVRLPGANSTSTLFGTVRRGRNGDGMTNLGVIENLGVFQGGVRSRLTSPPFYAENTPALLPGASARALAASRLALRRALRLK